MSEAITFKLTPQNPADAQLLSLREGALAALLGGHSVVTPATEGRFLHTVTLGTGAKVRISQRDFNCLPRRKPRGLRRHIRRAKAAGRIR